MSQLQGYFITGTDTGVGKTWVSCGLITALQRRNQRVIGMKPIASGCQRTPAGLRNDDALRLQAVSTVEVPYDSINPYSFEPHIAPHIAAREAGVEIAFARIRALAEALALHADYLIIEGVGGWRVPLCRDGDVAALAAALNLPVVLVVGIRLGCLNHAFLSVEAISTSGLPLAGWVGNLIDPHTDRVTDNLETLKQGIAAPCLGITPFLPAFAIEPLAACLHLEALFPPQRPCSQCLTENYQTRLPPVGASLPAKGMCSGNLAGFASKLAPTGEADRGFRSDIS